MSGHKSYNAYSAPEDPRNHPQYIEHVFDYHVPSKQTPERVDTYLTRHILHATRTKVQRAIEAGKITINEQTTKASRKVQPGDHIVCRVMKLPPLKLIPENIPLEVVYEDEDLLVVNKRAGMVTHPGFGNRYGTLVNALLWHLGVRDAVDVAEDNDNSDDDDENESDDGVISDDEDMLTADDFLEKNTPNQATSLTGQDEAVFSKSELYKSDTIRPGIVHRLDKDTSGIMVVAKNLEAHVHLSSQFAKKISKREYWALVWGNVKEDKGMIEGNIGRSPKDRKKFAITPTGKPAVTDFTVLERFQGVTLLSLKLRTGRTHQIRVHCTSKKHPLLSDKLYGGDVVPLTIQNIAQYKKRMEHLLTCITRQALHAKTLGFYHPRTGEWKEFDSDLPPDFAQTLEELRKI